MDLSNTMGNDIAKLRQQRELLCAISNELATDLSRLLKATPGLGKAVWHGGWTGLMIAADSGSLSCVQILLPCSDHTAINDQAQSALMRAAAGGHTQCVQTLLNARPHDLKGADQAGRSALHLAALNGSLPCLHELLYGSDVNALDQERCSAMELAVRQGHTACADALADHVHMDILERVLATPPNRKRLPRAWALLERHQLQLSTKQSRTTRQSTTTKAIENVGPRKTTRR